VQRRVDGQNLVVERCVSHRGESCKPHTVQHSLHLLIAELSSVITLIFALITRTELVHTSRIARVENFERSIRR
jgi:hypothetical protein